MPVFESTDQLYRLMGGLFDRICEIDPRLLSAPARRVAAQDIPIAYARGLERATLPDAEAIVAAVRRAVG